VKKKIGGGLHASADCMWRPFIPGHLQISWHTARRIRTALRENGSGSQWTVTGQSNLSSTPYGFIVAIQVKPN
jgi:hypothetical protein